MTTDPAQMPEHGVDAVSVTGHDDIYYRPSADNFYHKVTRKGMGDLFYSQNIHIIRPELARADLVAKPEWMEIDIDTMPKNEKLQIFSPSRGITQGIIRKQLTGIKPGHPPTYGWSLRFDDDSGAGSATHWQPLPPPPALQKGKRTSCE